MIVNRLNKLMSNAVCKQVNKLLNIIEIGTEFLPQGLSASLHEFQEFAAAVAESCDCLCKSCNFCVQNSHIGHLMHTQYRIIFNSICDNDSEEAKPIIDALDYIIVYLERYQSKS
jgi:hypothetical protein